jgi:hypothetical protein
LYGGQECETIASSPHFRRIKIIGSRVARFYLVQHTKTVKTYKITTKCTKWLYNISNVHICNITTSSIEKTSKIYPNLDFWFENIPSGNPDRQDRLIFPDFKAPLLIKVSSQKD